MQCNEIREQKELYRTHPEFLGFNIEEHPEDEKEILARWEYYTQTKDLQERNKNKSSLVKFRVCQEQQTGTTWFR